MSSVKINNEVNEVTIRRIIVWITSLSNIKTQVKHPCINSCKLWRNKNSKWVRNTHQSIFCLCTLRPWSLLFDERVPQNLPSWESTYSYQGTSEDHVHFPQLRYVFVPWSVSPKLLVKVQESNPSRGSKRFPTDQTTRRRDDGIDCSRSMKRSLGNGRYWATYFHLVFGACNVPVLAMIFSSQSHSYQPSLIFRI